MFLFWCQFLYHITFCMSSSPTIGLSFRSLVIFYIFLLDWYPARRQWMTCRTAVICLDDINEGLCNRVVTF